MIFIGIGSNLPSRDGPPRATAEAAVGALEASGIRVLRRSRWYETAPVPPSDQPWFVNGVIEVATDLPPEGLLAVLHRIEADFGRARTVPNAARPLDQVAPAEPPAAGVRVEAADRESRPTPERARAAQERAWTLIDPSTAIARIFVPEGDGPSTPRAAQAPGAGELTPRSAAEAARTSHSGASGMR